MTAESVAAEKKNVGGENYRADADAERNFARRGVGKPQGFPDVVGEKNQKYERQIKKIAVHVLKDEREFSLAAVAGARLANGARRRVSPKRLVVGAAIIIAGETKSARR